MIISKNITSKDFKIITEKIGKTHLSYHHLLKDDFICVKDNAEIIGFGRIFDIGNGNNELSGLWVDENYRGKKMG